VTRTGRAGTYVRQLAGYRAFIPKALPPDPPIAYDAALMTLLSETDQALARLDAATEFLPDPELFVTMYVRKEAVLSSQIEGTQASLVDVLQHEAGARRHPEDIAEVVNYIRAMRHGLERLATLPLSLRLLREIHAELLGGVRGSEREPGEFRRSQNWIGPPGCTLASATFVPPPPEEAMSALGDLETFLHDRSPMPLLVKTALVHAQFETIHPFLDGNGRLGRLLITFLLCVNGALRHPVLYLSGAFKARRQEYYSRLQAVRDDGDFEAWLRFFLAGVRDVSREGTETARGVLALRERHRALVTERLRNPSAALVLLERLLQQPVVTVPQVAAIIKRTYPAASHLVGELERLGLLREVTGGARNRLFEYAPYVALFGELRP
jgi:Fic family protein